MSQQSDNAEEHLQRLVGPTGASALELDDDLERHGGGCIAAPGVERPEEGIGVWVQRNLTAAAVAASDGSDSKYWIGEIHSQLNGSKFVLTSFLTAEQKALA